MRGFLPPKGFLGAPWEELLLLLLSLLLLLFAAPGANEYQNSRGGARRPRTTRKGTQIRGYYSRSTSSRVAAEYHVRGCWWLLSSTGVHGGGSWWLNSIRDNCGGSRHWWWLVVAEQQWEQWWWLVVVEHHWRHWWLISPR